MASPTDLTPERRAEAPDPAPCQSGRRGPAPGAPATAIRVTLGELIEAVGSATPDLAEQAVVVDHILRTRRVADAVRLRPDAR